MDDRLRTVTSATVEVSGAVSTSRGRRARGQQHRAAQCDHERPRAGRTTAPERDRRRHRAVLPGLRAAPEPPSPGERDPDRHRPPGRPPDHGDRHQPGDARRGAAAGHGAVPGPAWRGPPRAERRAGLGRDLGTGRPDRPPQHRTGGHLEPRRRPAAPAHPERVRPAARRRPVPPAARDPGQPARHGPRAAPAAAPGARGGVAATARDRRPGDRAPPPAGGQAPCVRGRGRRRSGGTAPGHRAGGAGEARARPRRVLRAARHRAGQRPAHRRPRPHARRARAHLRDTAARDLGGGRRAPVGAAAAVQLRGLPPGVPQQHLLVDPGLPLGRRRRARRGHRPHVPQHRRRSPGRGRTAGRPARPRPAAGEREARADRPVVVEDPRTADADDPAHPRRPRPPPPLGGRAGRGPRVGAPDGGQLGAGTRRRRRGGDARAGRDGGQLGPAPSGPGAGPAASSGRRALRRGALRRRRAGERPEPQPCPCLVARQPDAGGDRRRARRDPGRNAHARRDRRRSAARVPVRGHGRGRRVPLRGVPRRQSLAVRRRQPGPAGRDRRRRRGHQRPAAGARLPLHPPRPVRPAVHLRSPACAPAGGGERVHRRDRPGGRHGRERPVRRVGPAGVRADGRGPARRRHPAAVPAATAARHGGAGAAGRPHWLDGTDVARVRADAQFFSVLGGAR